MYIHLNHCRTSADGRIDMLINSNVFYFDYQDAPKWNFGVQTFTIPYTKLSLHEENQFDLVLNQKSLGHYWLSDIAFSFEDETRCRKFGQTYHATKNTTGAFYKNVTITDSYRKGNPYLLFNQPNSTCTIQFFTPKEYYDIEELEVNIALNHCATTSVGKINIFLNDQIYRSNYVDAPEFNFGVQNFEIPYTFLNVDGKINTFVIQGAGFVHYWLSDVEITYEIKKLIIRKSAFDSIVKNWILKHRKNIVELKQIPRDDLSAWEFIKNAPSWFYLPFVPASPTEFWTILKHFPFPFPFKFILVCWQMKEINKKASDFHKELLRTDIPKKNSFRHAYWMALTTRKFGAEFAIDLGDAQEFAHLDLTIEGPFDRVTDKINNMVGVEIGRRKNEKDTNFEILVENAWNNNELAWAKNFREENKKQTADVFWDLPLKNLTKNFKAIPYFTELEKSTLAKYGVKPDFKPVN